MTEEEITETQKLTAKVELALRNRYAYPEWAICFEVHSDNGRMADAIAINMWPSRSFVVHGFEIKASRGDWLKELKTPSKADFFVGQCNAWYIVAAKKGIVLKEEVPKGWGFMELRKNGIFTLIHPTQTYEATPSRGFYTSLIRRIFESKDVSRNIIWEAERRGIEKGEKEAIDRDWKIKPLEEKAKFVDMLKEKGLEIWHYEKGEIECIVAAMKLINVLKGDSYGSMLHSLDYLKRSHLDAIEQIEKCEKKVNEVVENIEK